MDGEEGHVGESNRLAGAAIRGRNAEALALFGRVQGIPAGVTH